MLHKKSFKMWQIFDDIDVAKKNSIDELQGKNYVKDSYLNLNQTYEYFGINKINPRKFCPGNQQGLVMKN